MRLTSLFAAVLIGVGIWYWFAGRHDGSTDAVAAQADTQDVAQDGIQDGSATPVEQGQDQDKAQDQAQDENQDPPVSVVVMRIKARDAATELTVRGRTKANRSVDVSAETSGRVASAALPAGSRVKAGQVLCRLNPGIRAAELAEAEASVTEAQAEAQAANQLRRKGFAAETTAKARQAALRAAQARLDRVRWDIAQLEIKAPFDGVLETDSAETGTLMSSGSVCATVIDLSKVKVAGYVAEQDIDQLAVGQPANATLINGMQAAGTVSFIARMADAETRTYGVEVTMGNPGRGIRDGMTAELKIPLAQQRGHLLPQSALTLDDNGRLGVRLAKDGRAIFAAVEILSDTPDGIWVTGLPETATVIIIGQQFVREGRLIDAVDAASLASAGGLASALQAAAAAGGKANQVDQADQDAGKNTGQNTGQNTGKNTDKTPDASEAGAKGTE